MKKKIISILCSALLAVSMGTADIVSLADSADYAISPDGIVYYLGDAIFDNDMLPDVGTVVIDNHILGNAMKTNPSAQFAVEIHAFVQEEGFIKEATLFKDQHFADGKSYTEILDELVYSGNYTDETLTEAQKDLIQQLTHETSSYVAKLIEEQELREAGWLSENGIQVLDSNGTRIMYAIVSREQLLNFPVSSTTGYKVFCTKLDNVTANGAETTIEPENLFGDINYDGEVNASDAASVLIYSAEHGAGIVSGDSNLKQDSCYLALSSEITGMEGYSKWDFNHDGEVNASDAAIILIYAAEHGAGTFSGTFEEYVNR